MIKKSAPVILLAVCCLFSFATAFADSPDRYITLDRVLAEKNLDRSQIDLRNPTTEDIFNPNTEQWEQGKKIFEVWLKERPLRTKDQRVMLVARRPFTEVVTKQIRETNKREVDVLVKDEVITEKKTTTKKRKRYMTSR